MDKFQPISCGSEVDHADNAVGRSAVSGGDGVISRERDAFALPIGRSGPAQSSPGGLIHRG